MHAVVLRDETLLDTKSAYIAPFLTIEVFKRAFSEHLPGSIKRIGRSLRNLFKTDEPNGQVTEERMPYAWINLWAGDPREASNPPVAFAMPNMQALSQGSLVQEEGAFIGIVTQNQEGKWVRTPAHERDLNDNLAQMQVCIQGRGKGNFHCSRIVRPTLTPLKQGIFRVDSF